MTPDERVEAERRWPQINDTDAALCGAAFIQGAQWAAAGVSDLEAENARLRERLGHEVKARAYVQAEHDTARQELADLRAGVLVVLDTYRPDLPWQVEQDLRALLGGAQ